MACGRDVRVGRKLPERPAFKTTACYNNIGRIKDLRSDLVCVGIGRMFCLTKWQGSHLFEDQ